MKNTSNLYLKAAKSALALAAVALPGALAAAAPCHYKEDLYKIRSKSRKIGLDYRLVYAIIKVESGWNARAKGDGGRSYGLMQVQCATARSLGPLKRCSDLINPETNLHFGMAYLKSRIDLYGKKDVRLAVAAYNSGRPIFKNGKLINQGYVSRVLKEYKNSPTPL